MKTQLINSWFLTFNLIRWSLLCEDSWFQWHIEQYFNVRGNTWKCPQKLFKQLNINWRQFLKKRHEYLFKIMKTRKSSTYTDISGKIFPKESVFRIFQTFTFALLAFQGFAITMTQNLKQNQYSVQSRTQLKNFV